ncbi:cellulase family glycosylhydrolase, partial [candidate division WOR-3 bacterium]|nr:cellulase family glycosylhydrolase [candidate division WOR-3 bacterium]
MNKSILTYLFLILFFIILVSTTCIHKQPALKEPGFPEAFIPDGIGVNIHFLGIPTKDMALLTEANIKLIRVDLTWAQVERERNEYNFSNFDQLVDAYEKQGGRILFILDYKNRLYGKEKSIKTDEQRNGFARFSQEAAKRYKDRGVVWEIWNEPNIAKFWGEEPNVDDYMALVKITCDAIREADRNSIIVAPATVGTDIKFIKGCAELGLFELVDGISVHPYRKGGPESVIKSYESLRNL